MDKAEEKNVIDRLFAAGEEQLNRVAQELLANPRFSDAVGKAVQTAFETKGKMDRNLQTVLNLLNVPSTKDVQKLATKVEALQGSLVNLNMKLDRLLAKQQEILESKAKAAAAKPE